MIPHANTHTYHKPACDTAWQAQGSSFRLFIHLRYSSAPPS